MPDEFARLNRALNDLRAGRRLVCEACGDASTGLARGWCALLTVDNEIATYCPDCARAEFAQD
jgi:hypothetical protein